MIWELVFLLGLAIIIIWIILKAKKETDGKKWKK